MPVQEDAPSFTVIDCPAMAVIGLCVTSLRETMIITGTLAWPA